MAVLQADTDIVFLVDTSGSMRSYIDRVKNALNNFADSLSNENVSFRLGLVDFGGTSSMYDNSYYKIYDFTDNVEDFQNSLAGLRDTGAYEYGLTAIQGALSMDFRENATKRFIMLTDEGYEENNYSYNSDSYVQSETIVAALNNAGVVLDVVGSVYDGKDEYEPIANATGGNFYDINALDYTTILNEIVQGIVIQNDSVTVNLNDVGESTTGIFVVTSYVNDEGNTTTTSAATFKASAEESDTVVGTVTAEKVYVAESGTEFNQNITIPEGWNVTASENNDRLNINGDNATVAGGTGNDRFYVGSSVSDVVFADFAPADDSISFSTKITPGSMNSSTVENELVISNDDISLTFENFTAVTTELYNESVNNGGVTNTVGELIDGEGATDTGRIVINPSAPVMMSLSHWSYGFTPSE